MKLPLRRSISICLFLLSVTVWRLPAQTVAALTGTITDETNASIPAADITLLKAGAIVKTGQTDIKGAFQLAGILPGTYTLRVSHFGFTPVETRIQFTPGQQATFSAQLKLATQAQTVTVQGEALNTVSVDPSQNANALVLRQAEIDALPDDPDDLETDLQQLAGPAAGPNGGQIYIDGFTGGRLPPKESIREIRINQNPFSSEYDRLGYGRIEILTKPGSDKWHGQAFFNDSDGIFNARNPLLTVAPDFSTRQYGGNLTGALNKKTSIFFDFEQRLIDDSGVVDAYLVNPTTFVATQFNQAVAAPQKRTDFSPRVDYQLTPNNTLILKYSYLQNDITNGGVGSFSYATQGVNTTMYENSIQVTDTAVLGASTINETRFRWLRDSTTNNPVQTGTTIDVGSTLVDGGSSTAKNTNSLTNFELQNYTSQTKGAQTIKWGLRIRSYQYSQDDPANFLGTYLFAGGPGETSLQQYQLALQGLAFPSQFSISTGSPYASIDMLDAGLFFQDDWRIKPNLTLNFGLRYEIQNQISDFKDIAPRFGFAWSPDSKGNKQGKTVIRGGAGIFYDRFMYNYSLNAQIYGHTIQQYLIQNPQFFGTTPTAAQLAAASSPQTVYQVDPNLHAPESIQGAIGVERALPRNSRLAVNFMVTRGIYQYLTDNINSPDPAYGNAQPYGAAAGNIYNYESDGVFNQRQLIVSFNTAVVPAVSLFSWYTLNWARSDTDGIGTFPANPYNIGEDYSRAQFDSRQRLFFGGSVTARYGLRFSPFMVYRSSQPFNITDGDDYLDTTAYTERPFITTLPCGTSGVVCNQYGKFETIYTPGEVMIPRNSGNGPSFFVFNLRVSKTWGFGEKTGSTYQGQGGGVGGGRGPGGGPGGGGPGGGGPRGGGGGMFGDASTGRKYNLTLTAQARNLFNTVNYANPIGVITSPFFGESNQLANFGPGGSSADNRRLEFGLRFAF
jgi:hypothetical protein